MKSKDSLRFCRLDEVVSKLRDEYNSLSERYQRTQSETQDCKLFPPLRLTSPLKDYGDKLEEKYQVFTEQFLTGTNTIV